MSRGTRRGRSTYHQTSEIARVRPACWAMGGLYIQVVDEPLNRSECLHRRRPRLPGRAPDALAAIWRSKSGSERSRQSCVLDEILAAMDVRVLALGRSVDLSRGRPRHRRPAVGALYAQRRPVAAATLDERN